jgi:hypothetical protein
MGILDGGLMIVGFGLLGDMGVVFMLLVSIDLMLIFGWMFVVRFYLV